MPRSLATIAALVLAVTLPAATAQASDPLLSGYGGPGAGEQVVLGGGKASPSKPSSKASQTSTYTQDPATAPLKASTAPVPAASSASSSRATSTLTRKPQRKKSSSRTSQSKDEGHDDDQNATSKVTTTPAPLPGAPEVVAYPTRAGEVGDLPISAPGLLLIVLGVAAATLVGLGLRRISGLERDPDAQVPGR